MTETTYLVVAGIRPTAGGAFVCRITTYAEVGAARRGFQALRAKHFGADDFGSLIALQPPDGLKIVCWFGMCPSVRHGSDESDESEQRPRRLRAKARQLRRKPQQ